MSEWTLPLLDELSGATGLQVDRGVRARYVASADWGGLVFGAPAAVVRPCDADGIAAVVAFASDRGLNVTVRATGASSGGQSVADRTLALDVTRLDSIAVDPRARTVTCGPGATWRSVLRATLEHGLAPYVMPLQLDLTVGGVVSVGGFGAIGHRFGVVAQHVEELDVVAGGGERVTCDRTSSRDLFDIARAGLGRGGVITRLTLALRDAAQHVRMTRQRSSSVQAWTDGILALADAYARDDAPVVHVEGFCRNEDGRLACDLQVGVEVGRDAVDLPELAADASAEPLLSEERPFDLYASRLDPRFEEMVEAGYVDRTHPWIESLVSPEAFVELLPEVMAGVAGDAGDRIQIVLLRNDGLPPLVAAPAGPLSVCFVIVPRGIPRSEASRATEAMERVNRLLVDAGGKRYLAGWLPDTTEAAWRRHFGDERYDEWNATRSKYDPNGTLTSALFAPLDAR
jgi:cytokinin dehydrogenase